MSRLLIEVIKIRWIRKPLVRAFTVTLDDDFGGYLHIDGKQHVEVRVTVL